MTSSTPTAKQKKPAARKAVAPSKAAPAKKTVVAKKAVTPKSKATASNSKVQARAAKPEKKTKLVRDSFTIPKHEFAAVAQLKERAAQLKHPAKKSEVLRAAIMALAAFNDSQLAAALAAVPAIKTGRPKKA